MKIKMHFLLYFLSEFMHMERKTNFAFKAVEFPFFYPLKYSHVEYKNCY